MTSLPAWICEVFGSIQGEGLYCGQRQTFIRFAGCNMRCVYCDTAAAQEPQPAGCRIEQLSGCGIFEHLQNPVDADRLLSACRDLRSKVVALTGGEPLVQACFLAEMMPRLKRQGFRTYLETNGTLAEGLSLVIDDCDVIAMDLKLPSMVGGIGHWDEHARFLEIAAKTEVFAKTVVGHETTQEEIARCADLVASRDPRIPLVIQPVSGRRPVTAEHLMRLQDEALTKLEDVRVIPQCHRILGLL